MDTSIVYNFAQNLLLSISNNYLLITFLWLFTLVLEDIWSGLVKFLKLLLFPGMLIYIIVKIIVLRIYGVKISIYQSIGFNYSSAKIIHKISSPRQQIVFIFSLTTISLGLFLLFNLASNLIKSQFLVLILSWFSISFFVFGLPRKSDFALFFFSSLKLDLSIPLSYIVGFILLALGFIVFGLLYSIVLSLFFFSLVVLISLSYPSMESEDRVISDEDIVVLDE